MAPSPGTRPSARALLAARARAGEAAAFEALYRELAPVVHGVLLAWVAPQDADDLLQDVFVAAWRALPGLRDDEAVAGWLCVMARRAAARHARAGRTRPGALPEDLPDTRSGPPSDRSEEILAVLSSLPPAYRETLILRLVEGLTGRQIAAATGLTPDSVRVNLCRGSRMLRERLRRRGLP